MSVEILNLPKNSVKNIFEKWRLGKWESRKIGKIEREGSGKKGGIGSHALEKTPGNVYDYCAMF